MKFTMETVIHSFCYLSCDRSVAYSKSSTPHSAIYCFLFQFPVSSFPQGNSVAANVFFVGFPSLYPSFYLSFNKVFRTQFLRKISPIQLAFLLFTVRRIFRSFLALCNTSSFLTRSDQLIFSILLWHHISELSDLLSEVSKLCNIYKGT